MIIILFPPNMDYKRGLEYVKSFKDIKLEEKYHAKFCTNKGFYIRKGYWLGQDDDYGWGCEDYYYSTLSKHPHTLYAFNENYIGVI